MAKARPRGARLLVAVAAVAAAALTVPAASAAACEMAGSDRAWLQAALALSRQAEREFLQLESRPLPTIVAIDGACTYILPQSPAAETATPHQGTVRLPGGAEMPLGPIAVARHEGGGYFAMSLPSVWRAAGVTSELGLERLMDGVLLHELMHSRQLELADRALGPLAAGAGIADDDLSDDIVQQRFGSDPEYTAAWSEERDVLYQAAAAASEAEARALAAQALARLRARRGRWFVGANAAFAGLDDVFLTMEGMGQWLAYRALLSPAGGGVAPGQALPAVRRGGRQWSQDQGLALFLVVDRLLPGWQQRAFADPDWRAERLLAAALERRPS